MRLIPLIVCIFIMFTSCNRMDYDLNPWTAGIKHIVKNGQSQ